MDFCSSITAGSSLQEVEERELTCGRKQAATLVEGVAAFDGRHHTDGASQGTVPFAQLKRGWPATVGGERRQFGASVVVAPGSGRRVAELLP